MGLDGGGLARPCDIEGGVRVVRGLRRVGALGDELEDAVGGKLRVAQVGRRGLQVRLGLADLLRPVSGLQPADDLLLSRLQGLPVGDVGLQARLSSEASTCPFRT